MADLASRVRARVQPVGSTDPYIHFLLVADPGFGKTVMLGTASKGLFLGTDPEGTVSAFAFGSRAREIVVPNWTELNEAYIYLRDGGIKELGLDWVMLDNVSEAQNQGRVETMEKERKGKPHIDEFVPSQQAYQRSQNMTLDMVKKLNDLPVNTAFTAWKATQYDDEGNEYFAPAIHGQQGAIAQAVAGYMNVVGYGEVLNKQNAKGNDIRRIHFAQTGPHRGKDRFNALGKKRDDLTMDQLTKIVTEQRQKNVAQRAANTKATPARTRTATRPIRSAATTKAPLRRRKATP